MSSFDRDAIEAALLKKGFKLIDTHHRFYYYEHAGLITSIRTKISKGSDYKTYNDNLLGQIKKQLKFSSKKQLIDFIKCSFTSEDYVKHLKDSKFIQDNPNGV